MISPKASRISSLEIPVGGRPARPIRFSVLLFVLLVALCVPTASCRAPAEPPAGKNPETGNERILYYYRGKDLVTYHGPFVRCSRPGDFMMVEMDASGGRTRKMMGIRVLKKISPAEKITEKSFVATVNGKTIKANVAKLGEDVAGLWEIGWEINPSWKTIRVVPQIEVRFDFTIQKAGPDRKLVWVKDPEPWRKNGAPGTPPPEVCPP